MRERGTIQGVKFTPGSGLATLLILTDSGDCVPVHCDAGPLARALEASGAGVGARIEYELTGYGAMSHFTVED